MSEGCGDVEEEIKGYDRLMLKKFTIANLTIEEGDEVEVGFSRQRIHGKFMGVDRVLYAIVVDENETGDKVVVPYKSIKYIRVRKRCSK